MYQASAEFEKAILGSSRTRPGSEVYSCMPGPVHKTASALVVQWRRMR